MEFLKKKILDDMGRELGDRMAQAYKGEESPAEEEMEEERPSLREQMNSEPLTKATPAVEIEIEGEEAPEGQEAQNGMKPGGAGAQKMEMEGCDPSRLNEEEQAELERLYAKMAD